MSVRVSQSVVNLVARVKAANSHEKANFVNNEERQQILDEVEKMRQSGMTEKEIDENLMYIQSELRMTNVSVKYEINKSEPNKFKFEIKPKNKMEEIFENIESLKKIDSKDNKNNKKDNMITLGELKEVAKKDGKEGLSKEDLSIMGIKDELVQEEIIKRFEIFGKAEASDDTRVFDVDFLLKNACKNVLKNIENSGGIRLILNKVLDENDDSKLSISELRNLNPQQKQEILMLVEKYNLNKSDVEVFFKSLELINEKYPNKSDEEIINDLFRDDKKKPSIISESIDRSATKLSKIPAPRAFLNSVLEKDFDGKITFGELRELFEDNSKLQKLRNMAKNNLIGEEYVNKLINNLRVLYDLNKGKINDEEVVISEDVSENGWKSNLIMVEDGEPQLEIDKAKNDNRSIPTLKDNLILKSGNNKEIISLLNKLGNNLTKETIHYISKLLDKYPNDINKVASICNKLNNYYNSQITNKSLVKNQEEKIDFINQVLHDISYPTDIDQKNKGTCAATAVQMKLALIDPEKYVDIATTLAQGENFQISNDKIIRPNGSFTGDEEDERITSWKIIQNAFMEYTRDHDVNVYNDKNKTIEQKFNSKFSGRDGLLGPFGDIKKFTYEQRELGKGVYDSQRSKLEEDLFGGTNLIKVKKDNINTNIDYLMGEIDDDLMNKHRPVTISFKGHAVTLLSKKTDENPPKYLFFSWGKVFAITKGNLENFIQSAIVSED